MGYFLKILGVLYMDLGYFFVKILIRTARRFRLCGSSNGENGNEIDLARVKDRARTVILIKNGIQFNPVIISISRLKILSPVFAMRSNAKPESKIFALRARLEISRFSLFPNFAFDEAGNVTMFCASAILR
jgi:hypothetical protein